MPNSESVVYFLVVDFVEGCCCSSTPCPFDLDWSLTIYFKTKTKSIQLGFDLLAISLVLIIFSFF